MSNKYAETSKVKISTLNKNGKTILDDVYVTSPFKVAPPFYKSDDFIKVIIMSSSAGTLEGDVQEYDINLSDNTKMELTSQSFEKIHKFFFFFICKSLKNLFIGFFADFSEISQSVCAFFSYSETFFS